MSASADHPGAGPGGDPDSQGRPWVFHVHGISKIYRMGDVEVHALRGVALDLYVDEVVLQAPRAAASRRSTSSAGSTRPRAAMCGISITSSRGPVKPT